MKKYLFIFFILLQFFQLALADEIDVSITPKKIQGKMGDIIHFKSLVKNSSNKTVHGLVIYISLVKITAGQETPMDLEDWNAQKAMTVPTLKMAEYSEGKWTMRLIDSGDYLVYITAVDKEETRPVVSEIANLNIVRRQSLNPNNVIPIALGVPLLLSGIFIGITRFRS